jgi:drug/metabolite transporter (DMT)-like permease
VLLAIATLTLIGNYVLYLVALDHVTPSVTQVVIQLAPLMLLIGGVVVFHEHFARTQWIGFVILGTGLLLFFNERLPLLLQPTEGLGLGVSLTVAAGVCWAALRARAEEAARAFLRAAGSVDDLRRCRRAAAAGKRARIDPRARRLQLGMLGFCCANTLVAYGSFGEALYHWDLSRVSAVLATAPLFTIAGMWVVERFGLGLVAAEGLNGLSVAGALMVVVGSMTCALAARK